MLRLYRGLLYLYPAAYRREFAEEMAFGLSLWGALWSLLLFLAFVCVTVGVIWGVLYATGRSGTHRLANVQTWPERH